MRCPACHSTIMQEAGAIPFRDFDGSVFNFTSNIMYCKNCGFVKMDSLLSDDKISKHYAEHCLYHMLAGVGVGGGGREDITRYHYYYDIIKKHALLQGKIADIGCSKGGFVKYLDNYDSLEIIGVDIDKTSLAQLGSLGKEGSAFNLPFGNSSVDLLCYFHVLEHIVNVDEILIEANRVLKNSGHIVIEVPDAIRYKDARIGALFWFAMKEHINHFSPHSLVAYCRRNGFNVEAIYRSELPMVGENYRRYPSLILLLTKSTASFEYTIHKEDSSIVDCYLSEKELFEKEIDELFKFINKYSKITLWGIGLEFFNLWAHYSPILNKLDVCFVDANPKKQGLYVDGKEIGSPFTTTNRTDGGLVCCSFLSRMAIVESAKIIGWKSEDIFCLTK
jgi:SAM-dependent methyltransferase